LGEREQRCFQLSAGLGRVSRRQGMAEQPPAVGDDQMAVLGVAELDERLGAPGRGIADAQRDLGLS